MKESMRKHPDWYRELDLESVKAMKGIAGISMDPALMKEMREDGEEVYNMCKAFEDYKEEGREEGRLEIIRRLMMNLNLSLEQVLKLLDIPVSDSDKYRSAIEYYLQ